MDRFEALRTFVAVADNRSFAEAARRLRISPTAASRAIGDLEKGARSHAAAAYNPLRWIDAGRRFLSRAVSDRAG